MLCKKTFAFSIRVPGNRWRWRRDAVEELVDEGGPDLPKAKAARSISTDSGLGHFCGPFRKEL